MSKKIIPIAHERSLLVPSLSSSGHVQTPAQTLVDKRQRRLHDLRISVTDRCNFRCTYCMPKEVFDHDYEFLPQAELLTFEEITRIARIAVGLGVTKIRLTGGEPLLRKGIENLIAMLHEIPGIDLTLTTNGSALKAKAAALKAAGLKRITISLDSLDDATFRRMNDVDFPVAKVLESIDAAAAAGLGPVKINMVVKRGVNDHDIVEMARRFKGTGHIVRFIEFMDVGATNGWLMNDVIPSAEIIRQINQVFPLEIAESNYQGEVAQRWRYQDSSGEIGVISSVTHAFCGTCTRARLSTHGGLYTCLFAQQGYDLKTLLRSGKTDDEIRDAMAAIWQHRSDNYSEIRTAETHEAAGNSHPRKVEMSFIGG